MQNEARTASERYTGLKSVKKKLASGRVVEYYYDRKLNKPIKGKPGTSEFDENYVAVTGRPLLGVEVQPSAPPNSILDVWQRFEKSPEFLRLSSASQHDIRRHLDVWLDNYGSVPAVNFDRQAILEVREAFGDKPRACKHYIQTISRLLSFAIDRGIVKYNVASRIKVDLDSRDQVWQADDIRKIITAANPWVGAAVVLSLLTGQRQEDVLTLRRDQIRDRAVWLRQGKTMAQVRLAFDDHPDLERFLDTWFAFQPQSADGTILTGQRGRAWSSSGFRCEFTKAKLMAQSKRIDDLMFLDLRRTAVVELALAGVPMRAIGQVTGHADSSLLEILKVYLPRSVILDLNGERRPRRRAELIGGVAHQSSEMTDLTAAWIEAAQNFSGE